MMFVADSKCTALAFGLVLVFLRGFAAERVASEAVDAAYAYYLDEPTRVWTDDAAFIAAIFGFDFVNDPPAESVVFSHGNTGDEVEDVTAMETVRTTMVAGDVLVSALSNGCVYARFIAGDVYGTRHCRILGPVAGDGRLWESDAGSQLFNRREVGGYCLAGGTRGTRSFRLIRPLLSDRVRLSSRRHHPKGIREPDADVRVNGLAESAYAYYLRGTLAQYDSVPLVPDEDSFYRWARKFHRTPIEEATADKTYYAVCSAFVQGVYFDALGQDYDYPEPVTYNLMELSPKETIVFSYDAKASGMSADAAVMQVRELIRPGDIITGSNYPKGGGHVMLCYGRVDGHLKLIHSSGNKYDMSTGVDAIESEGTVYLDDLEAALFVKGHYVDLAHYRRFALIRPLVDGNIRLTPTAEARLRHPGLRYDRRVTGGVYGSVVRGGTIDYTVSLENHSDRAYDVEIVEGGVHETVSLSAGASRALVHPVVVDAPVGTYYAQNASAGGIPGSRLETQVVARRWSVAEALVWAEANLKDRASAPGNRVRGWFGGRDCREGEPTTRLREARSRDLMPGDVVLSYAADGMRRIWVKGEHALLEKFGGEIRPVAESRVTALLSVPFFAAYHAR